jgi:hypothetical protein
LGQKIAIIIGPEVLGQKKHAHNETHGHISADDENMDKDPTIGDVR